MTSPPKYALRFLRWFCREDYLEEIEGDLVELFDKRVEAPTINASILFWWDVIKTFRWVNFRKLKIEIPIMNSIKNYLKIYFRRYKKETTHYLANILGLTLGFAVLFFVQLYVHDEQNLDTYHRKYERIYRVYEKEMNPEEGERIWNITTNPLAEALKEDFPEVEASAKMVYFGSSVLKYGDRAFAERNYILTTNTIFDIWDFEILAGDPQKEFPGTAAVVLTETMAKKLFGDEDPVGKVMEMPNRFEQVQVLAVIADMPRNSTYQFNALYITDFKKFEPRFQSYFDSWDSRFFTTWVLLKEGTSPEDLMAKKESFMAKYLPEEIRDEHDFYLQPIADIHLGSSEMEAQGTEPQATIPYSNRRFVSIILLIGFGVIVIASLNFINLSSVQALKRTLEAGIRKVNGASQASLRFQLLVETFMTLFIAYGLTVALVSFFLPQLNELTAKQFTRSDLFAVDIVIFQVLSILVIGLLTTLIPAAYYSRLNRSLVLEKNVFAGRGELLRKIFIAAQYALSMVLIVAVIVLFRQMQYVQTKNLGFEKERVIALDINSGPLRASFKSIKEGIASHASIEAVSVSSRVPGEWKSVPTSDLYKNLNGEPTESALYGVDKDWLETYDIQLKKGDFFRGNDAVDSLYVVLNERAVAALGLEEPVGTSINMVARDTILARVIGVVKDFHFRSLYEPIGPIALVHWNNPLSFIDYYSIRYKGNPADVLTHIMDVNDQYDPNTPAELNFLDERWGRYYQADESRSNLFFLASVISIFISVIGLFGMINYTIERKTKEIGIRKVLGASHQNIVHILTKDYVVLLLIAGAIAFPLSYYWLENWLSTFSYRISMGIGTFLFAAVVVLLVSGLTVIFRILRASHNNPVSALRYE